jgi:hypothetical protein
VCVCVCVCVRGCGWERERENVRNYRNAEVAELQWTSVRTSGLFLTQRIANIILHSSSSILNPRNTEFMDFVHRPEFKITREHSVVDLFPSSSARRDSRTLTQWLTLVLSKGPNREVVSPLSPEDGNRFSFRNVLFSIYLEFWMMGKAHKRPPLWSSGQNSWLEILRPGFDSRALQKIVGLERGPLSLMSTTEELLDRKVAAPV